MSRPLPRTSVQWLEEILLAWEDAEETKPFAALLGMKLTDAEMFHLAPRVCLKFRGLPATGEEAERVSEGTLANYVVNTQSGPAAHDLKTNPQFAFAFCYVAAHLVLGLLNQSEAEHILACCEKFFLE